jgi:hypothetical protein
VALFREPHEFGRLAEAAERDEPLLGLLLRAPQILLAVQDQDWRGDLLDVGQRRELPVSLDLVARRALELALAEPRADVAGPVERHEVGEAAHRDRRFEPLGVPDDPVRHVAAVAAASDAQPIGVHIRPLDHEVGRRHQILVVQVAPAAGNLGAELLAVPLAPPRIGVQHVVPLRGEHLKLVEERVPIERVRTAVNLQHQRTLAPPATRQEPALDRLAAGTDDLQVLGGR